MKMEASVDPQCRGPDWMPITPKTGSLFHAETQSDLPNPTNRGFIQKALESAAAAIQGISIQLLRSLTHDRHIVGLALKAPLSAIA
jgi:hypothetical protein